MADTQMTTRTSILTEPTSTSRHPSLAAPTIGRSGQSRYDGPVVDRRAPPLRLSAGVVAAAAALADGEGAGGAIGAGIGATTGADTDANLEALWEMQRQSQEFNAEYLALQESMQSENQRFTALSNVLKAQHDTAKAAINNIHV